MRTGEWKSTSMTCSTSAGREVGDVRALRDRGVVDEHVEAAERVPRFERDLLGAFEIAEVGGPHLRVGRVLAALRRAPRRAARRAGRRCRRSRPRSASIGASAAPMPDDAPVTRIFAPSSFTRLLLRATRARPTRRCPSTSSTPPRARARRTPRRAPRARLCRPARPARRARRGGRRAGGRRRPRARARGRRAGPAPPASVGELGRERGGRRRLEVRRVAVVPAAVVAPDVAHDELGLVVDRPQVRPREQVLRARAPCARCRRGARPRSSARASASSERLQQLARRRSSAWRTRSAPTIGSPCPGSSTSASSAAIARNAAAHSRA